MTISATIPARLNHDTIGGPFGAFLGVRLWCPAEPKLDGLYMGRTMTEAAVGLAEINDRREALGLPVLAVR